MHAKRTILPFAVLFVALVLTSCAGPLTQAQAIARVVEKNPGFPDEPGKTNSIETPIGGPFGRKAKVDLTIAVEPSGTNSFVVTLIKNWNLSVNGTPVVSTWKYEVKKGSVTLLESHDADGMVNIIK